MNTFETAAISIDGENHYKNEENKIRYECQTCKVVFVRIQKGRRHDTIEMYAPAGVERLY